MDWGLIATKYFAQRTAIACRKRHERLVEMLNNSESRESSRMEKLSKAYIDLREQVWTILADRVGENWQILEAKVRVTRLHLFSLQR